MSKKRTQIRNRKYSVRFTDDELLELMWFENDHNICMADIIRKGAKLYMKKYRNK
jgi:hypothetical protein